MMRTPRTLSTLAVLAVGAAGQAQLTATQIASGLSVPVGFYASPTTGVGYVTQKGGQLVQVGGGTVLDVANLFPADGVATDGERGFLGFAFDPDYATNNRVYVSYVVDSTKALRVARLNGFDPSTAQTIIDVAHPAGANNHYGGTIRFGGDGKLYVGMGDGGGGNDPENDAQNIDDNFLGKILRLDVSGSGPGYAVPSDNPFVGKAGLDEIWAYGLRNPFKYSFDTNGDLYIGDVGQDTREEVDRIGGAQGGVNFGWRAREGLIQNPMYPGEVVAGAVDPIYDYDHSVGRSITGGRVYRGSALGSAYVGRYFFGDYIAHKIWSIDPNAPNVGASLIDHTSALGITPGVVSFDTDINGELILTDLNSGRLYRIDAVPEPGTYAVLGLGLLAVLRRRRKA